MVEAIALASHDEGDVVVSVADDSLPPPFDVLASRDGLGVGICLRSERPSSGALAIVSGLRVGDASEAWPSTLRGRAIPEALRRNPTVSALALVDAVLSGEKATIALAHDAPRPFVLDVAPVP
jgi:hypothetical protein